MALYSIHYNMEHNMKCEKCGTEWEDTGLPEWVACDCPICDNDDGETYLIESTTLDDWCTQ